MVQLPERRNRFLRFLTFIQLVRKERPDLFLIDCSGMIFITSYIISLFSKIPFSARMRGDIWQTFEEQKTYLGFLKLMYVYIILRICTLILKKSCRVFPVSTALAIALEAHGVQKEKIRILRYPVDSEKFRPLKKKKDSITILSVTNFSFKAKYKALISVLPYIDEVLTNYRNVNYIVIGDGLFSSEFEEAVKRMKNSERVSYVGYQEKIEKLFAESDIFLHFSLMDGFPAAVVEAMSCELPVVANPYEAMAEQIGDGVTGFLVDSSSLKETLELLIKDEKMRKEMGQRGRAHIVEKFSMEVISREFEREIEDLIGG